MALIKCSECGKEVSDKAVTCPSCGNPINAQVVAVDAPVEIELTNKKWKKRRLWGLLVLAIGALALLRSVPLGIFIIFIAIIIAMSANIGAWWTNG